MSNERYIKPYNYVPLFKFHKLKSENKTGLLYLGCEIKIDCGGESEENAEIIHKFFNTDEDNPNIYFTRDGSLNYGFEIDTMPCSYEYHKQLPYIELFNKLKLMGYQADDTKTCGLHIHINRNYFSKNKIEQELCIVNLIYLTEKFWNKVILIGRRKSNRYARRKKCMKKDCALDLYSKYRDGTFCKSNRHYYISKYRCINLCHNNTIEIRIFKGTLDYDTFMSTLEFVKCMTETAKENTIYNIQNITWEDISCKFSDRLNEYILKRENIKKQRMNKEIKNEENVECFYS